MKDQTSENDFFWRDVVGGKWDEIGYLQYNFLLSQGLLPSHKFLDVGCGSFRGGVHFAKYLNLGNYYGIDKNQQLISKGIEFELNPIGTKNQNVHILCRDDFRFSVFNSKFDFALAQSVFTHLPWNRILLCLEEMKKVLAPFGRFYATFFEDLDGNMISKPLVHKPGGITTYSYKDPYHYSFNTFDELSRRTFLNVEYIGEWNHPRAQKMMVFTHN